MTLFSTQTSGPEDAPTLVFLHGFMGSAADFEPAVRHLEDRFHCVRVDLPGHAEAPLPKQEELSLPSLARSLRHEVLDRQARPPTLIGYSMGGRLALQTALDHPASVGRLVLVSTSPGISGEAAREQRRDKDCERAASIRTEFAAFLDAWYRLPIFGDLAHTPQYQAMLDRRLKNAPEHMARVICELSPGRQLSNWHRLDELENTTWIVGAGDPKYRALGQRLEAEGHRVVVADGAAHAVHVERAGWFSQQIDAASRSVPDHLGLD